MRTYKTRKNPLTLLPVERNMTKQEVKQWLIDFFNDPDEIFELAHLVAIVNIRNSF